MIQNTSNTNVERLHSSVKSFEASKSHSGKPGVLVLCDTMYAWNIKLNQIFNQLICIRKYQSYDHKIHQKLLHILYWDYAFLLHSFFSVFKLAETKEQMYTQ